MTLPALAGQRPPAARHRGLLLTRLDKDATEDQITELLGRPPSPLLVEQVYERSRGNPYFSELLVRRGDLASAALPDDLPDELSQALLDAWRSMSAAAREIARILAIAGRPTDLESLDAVAGEIGVANVASVREAVDAGVIVLGNDGAWFRHPLLAGVLAESYLPREAAPVHAAWASHLTSFSADGVDELRRLGDLATHHECAGDAAAAFRALLEGVDLARGSAALARPQTCWSGADLWKRGANVTDVVGHARLLERVGDACLDVGRVMEGYRLMGSARDLVPPEDHPVWAAAHRTGGEDRLRLGRDPGPSSPAIERFVEVSRAEPDSPRTRPSAGLARKHLVLEEAA